MVFFNYETRNAFGTTATPKAFCCNDDLAAKGECVMGEVIVRNQTGVVRPLGLYKVAFSGDHPVANMHFRYSNMSTTSTYYVAIANCKEASNADLLINGRIEFKNPYGWLPGASVGMWYYYGLQALAYMLVAITYAVLMVLYRTQLLRIQYGILGLLVLGMIQTFCWYLYELKRNQSGLQSNGTGALVMSIFFTAVIGTVTRLVVLVVCMGIGLIKWTLGSLKFPVFALSGSYFLFSLFYEVIEMLKNTSTTNVNSFVTAIILFGVWICNTLFIWWSLVSVIRTMGQLTLRRQTIKLTMYKRLFWVMIGCVVVWVISLFIHFIILATHQTEQIWRSNWLWLAFWHFSFFVIVCIFAVLWRPTKNNTRYGYSEVYYDDENEGEAPGSQLADNEVQLHAVGASSPAGETRTRAFLKESRESGSSRQSEDENTLSFSNKFDTASAFALDDDDILSAPRKLD